MSCYYHYYSNCFPRRPKMIFGGGKESSSKQHMRKSVFWRRGGQVAPNENRLKKQKKVFPMSPLSPSTRPIKPIDALSPPDPSTIDALCWIEAPAAAARPSDHRYEPPPPDLSHSHHHKPRPHWKNHCRRRRGRAPRHQREWCMRPSIARMRA